MKRNYPRKYTKIREENTKLKLSQLAPIIGSAAIVMSLALWSQGRIWWCKLGDYSPYVHEAWNSTHTSQHLFDPYTFTHILHGVALFWIVGLIFRKFSRPWRFGIAVFAEAAWEVFENSSYVIEKYRENTASLDYFGDSILNSVGDLAACAFGIWVGFKLGWWRSLIFFAVVEMILILWIRDSLMLNILMLIYPLEAVKHWQMAIGS